MTPTVKGEITKGTLVRRTYGDKYLRAEKGRVLWVADGRAYVEWYCVGGGTTKSKVIVSRLAHA